MGTTAPEEVIDQRDKVLLLPAGQRGKICHVTLTTDRILFSQQRFMATPGAGLLEAVVAGKLEQLVQKHSGGPYEVLRLADVRAVRRIRRPLRGDVYEFELADGTKVAIGASAMKRWDGRVRELLSDRHGRTVSDDGDGGWRVA